MLKIAVCDDDPTSLETMKVYFEQFSINNDYDIDVQYFRKADIFLSTYVTKDAYDLIFLDIEMPGMNGLAVADQIRHLPDFRVKIVFVTSFPEYMQESFGVHPYHYLVKPLTYPIFQNLLLELLAEMKETFQACLLLDSDDCETMVQFRDVIFIETRKDLRTDHQLLFHTAERVYHIRGRLADWIDSLTKEHFYVAHKGVLINLKHVLKFLPGQVVMDNDERLPVSRRNELELHALFTHYILDMKYRR